MTRRSPVALTLMLLATIPAVGLLACSAWNAADGGRCEKLRELQLDHVKIVSATPASAQQRFNFKTLFVGVPFLRTPAACEVRLLLTPTAGSQIRSEVWLPQTNWNGRFQGLGNGGFAGSIDDLSLPLALQRGYAAASTDTGHQASDKDGSWALGHPEKIVDYGYRAIHDMTVAAKAIVTAYYGRAPEHSYFGSCSNGGREGLMEAQRYPDDYDGILAGAPAYDASNTIPTWAWIQQRLVKQPGGYIPTEKLSFIGAAVLKACDELDGVKDGVLEDPRACHFKPETLQCAAQDRDDCLTGAQVQSLRQIYDGPGGSLGDSTHHGFEKGGEADWGEWFVGSKPGKSVQYGYALEFYRYLVYGDAFWTLDRFDFGRDRAAMKSRLGPVIDATDPDLTRFVAHGGKLILYHGWSDAALQPRLAIDYYEKLQASLGAEQTGRFARLYMVPGLQHCFKGPGPNVFGQLAPAVNSKDASHSISAALEQWVEQGITPAAIIATKYDSDIKPLIVPDGGTVVRTRPLCPYPQVAHWQGGSTDDAAHFACASPQPPPPGS